MDAKIEGFTVYCTGEQLRNMPCRMKLLEVMSPLHTQCNNIVIHAGTVCFLPSNRSFSYMASDTLTNTAPGIPPWLEHWLVVHGVPGWSTDRQEPVTFGDCILSIVNKFTDEHVR